MISSPLTNVLSAACRAASKILRRDFIEIGQLQSSIKGNQHFAIESLKKTTSLIEEILLKAKPDYGFIAPGKKIKSTNPQNNYFVVDPISGFDNFKNGSNRFAISIGVLKRQNVPFLGVVYEPVRNIYHFGEIGGGALTDTHRAISAKSRTINNYVLHVDTLNTLIRVTSKANHQDDISQERSEKLPLVADQIRITKCPALDLIDLVTGSSDSYLGFNIPIYQYAALAPILIESKCKISSYQNNKIINNNKYFLAGTPAIFNILIQHLNKDL